MSFTAADWPRPASRDSARHPRTRRRGVVSVWRWEITKLTATVRVRTVLPLCLLVPFLLAGAVSVQSAVPSDTLFGQWVHESGFALPMVAVGFAGQWALPLLVAVVLGDLFSAEDHFGTWKTVLTRSRTRGQVFTGKVLAGITYTVVTLVALTAASVLAGFTLGAHPVVGLAGQLVPSGRAASLVLASWALQLPPMLGFASVAVFLSILSRNSVVGIGAPVVLGLVFQLLALVDLPSGVRVALLSTPFQSWHGLWVTQVYLGPVWHGLVTSAAWFLVFGLAAWVVFARRSLRVS